METTWYSNKELKKLGLKTFGNNVLVSRKTTIISPELVSLGSNVRIDDFCILTGQIEILDYVHIAAYTGLYGENFIKFYPFCGVSARCLVYSSNSDYSGTHFPSPMVPEEYKYSTGGPVIFEKHVTIGAGSIVLPDITLHTGAVTGAMSLVTNDLEPWTINTGIPAKKLKNRKKEIIILEEELRNKLSKNTFI